MRKIDTEEQLRVEMTQVLQDAAVNKGLQTWVDQLHAHLTAVSAGIPERLMEAAFLKDLFDSPAVTSTTLGNINISPAVNDQAFRRWFADRVVAILAVEQDERGNALSKFYGDIQERIVPLISADTPRFKILRALAALFPQDFTTIASTGTLHELYRALGGGRPSTAVTENRALRVRLDALIPELPGESPEHLQARRMTIPWMLCEHLEKGQPAVREERPKIPGLTAFKNTLQAVLRILPLMKPNGLTVEQFNEALRQGYDEPIKESSLATMRRAITAELDLCVRQGTNYHLNERGKRLLESNDPDALKDHFLHRVLGVDHVLKALSAQPLPKSDVQTLLRQVHPAWKSNFMPSSITQWLAAVGVIELASGNLRLTDRGKRWANDIIWTPTFPVTAGQSEEEPVIDEDDDDDEKEVLVEPLVVPAFGDLWERMNQAAAVSGLSFPEQDVARLHAGLWLHPVRHFAVLAGISGSGKTQLALNYALALCGDEPGDLEHIKVIAVQPGWYDQTPLLGHASALHDSVYHSTPFLELLREASANPSQPYAAVLDEMNLSHPEQYMAQLLSAMELQEHIELHSIEEEKSGVPARIRYPSNLMLIGTVNMDETTHGLSDKVLDRAFTMEFMHSPIGEHPDWDETSNLPEPLRSKARTLLVELSAALEPCRLNFGRRTEADVIGYLKTRGPSVGALDEVVYAKVLPKLRGEDSRLFRTTLVQVLAILKHHELQACAQKVASLQLDLAETGSARFWR